MHKWIINNLAFAFMIMDEKNDEGKGGGGGGDDTKKAIADLQASNKALLERLDALTKKKPKTVIEDEEETDDDDEEQQDLAAKAKRNRDKEVQAAQNSKDLEAALKFDIGSKEWLKTNASLLPKDIADLFTTADKEKYDSAIEKVDAIKSGVVQSFFALQANMDLLTQGQKSKVEDYLKLTKQGKQEKARQVYEDIFEPAFEMLKRVKRADAVSRGFADPTQVDNGYKERLIKGSRKHFLGEQ